MSCTTTEAEALTGSPASVVVWHVIVVVPSGKCAVTEKLPEPEAPVSQLASSGSDVVGSNAFPL